MPVLSLEGFNPWWKEGYDMGDDPSVKAWEKSRARRDAGRDHPFMDGDLIYSLRGPRQVGKTTLLKLEVKRLLDAAAVPRRNVMYYSFDLGGTPADVVCVLDEYSARVRGAAEGRRFVFLDGITAVRDRQKAIKVMKDMGRLEEHTIVVSGSRTTWT